MGQESRHEAVLQVRDQARARGVNAFFTLHREQSHLLRIGNSAVSLNTSEDLTRLDVEVLDGRRQGACTVMGDLADAATVAAALDRAVELAAVAMPRDYDPIQPVVEQTISEQPQFDPQLAALDPAVKTRTYAETMAAVGRQYNYSGSWSSGSTELFLAGTASDATAWHLGTDQHFTCVLKHPQQRWELACHQTGWRADEVTAAAAVADFRAQLPVFEGAPAQVEPGEYTVVFGPQAIAELVAMAMWSGFLGRGYEERQSWTAGTQIGGQLLSPLVSWHDDPAEAGTFRFGFDGAGLTRRRFALVDQGRLAGITYDLDTAARYGRQPTAHAGSWGLVMAPGQGPATLAEAIRPLGRALSIPALHYMNLPNRSKGIFTGSSRFGGTLIEDGRISRPLFSSRVTDTFARVFGQIEALGPRLESVNLSNTYGRRLPEAASVPSYMICTGVAITDCAEAF